MERLILGGAPSISIRVLLLPIVRAEVLVGVRLLIVFPDFWLSDSRRSSSCFAVVDGVAPIVKIFRRAFGFSSSEVDSSS